MINNKLPFGNIPRLLLAWVCTEAVRTQRRELVLGSSLSKFMRKLGMEDAPVVGPLAETAPDSATRWTGSVHRPVSQLIYEDEQREGNSLNSHIARP